VAAPTFSQGPHNAMNRKAQPTMRTPATTSMVGPRIAAGQQPRLVSRSNPSLERSVAQFTANPNQLLDLHAPMRDWRYIILHHSGKSAGGYASIDRFHREENKWDECGYHFVIGNGTESGDGEIEVGGRWSKQKHGAHTRLASKPESNLYNEVGIGICLVGDFNVSPPTPKQVEACRRLVAYLQDRSHVPNIGVTTHGTLDETDCPGRYFPHDRLIPNAGVAAR